MALYGLFLFYGLTRSELEGKRPVVKFLSIKLIIMFSFYQSFVVRCSITFVFSDIIGLDSSSGHWKAESYMVILLSRNNTTSLSLLATQFWTATNISNGLNALTICIEVHFLFHKCCHPLLLKIDDFLCGFDDVGLPLHGIPAHCR